MEMDELMRLAGLPGGGIERVAPDLEEMSDKEREDIPRSDFVFPDDRSWPINDLEHAKIALDWARRGFRVKRGSSKAKEIIKAVLSKYPELKGKKEESMSDGYDWVSAIQERHGLDEEARSFLEPSTVSTPRTEPSRYVYGSALKRPNRKTDMFRNEDDYDDFEDDDDLYEEGEGVEGAIKGLKAGMHMLRERADYLWDILEKKQGFDVRRRMGRLIENIKHTEESVYGFIDTFDQENDHSKENMKP